MGKLIDLRGKKFTRLTVIAEEKLNKKEGNRKWICKCECGNYITAKTSYLTSGDTKSCGCLKSERSKENASHINRTHGMTRTRLYKIWQGMKNRCYKENTNGYENYGKRGIEVCVEWRHNFVNFYNWAISNGYKDNLTIDRLDNNKNYEPENCKWSTLKEQSNNRRTNCFIEYNGEKHSMKEWSEILNISYATMRTRRTRGWKNEEILFGKRK